MGSGALRQRPEYDMKLIGRNLRRLRKAKGLSVDDVRKYLCMGSVQAVYKYEGGKSYPPVDTMFALMELYGASVEDIVGMHESIGANCENDTGDCNEKWRLASGVWEMQSMILMERMREYQAKRLERYYKLCVQYANRPR